MIQDTLQSVSYGEWECKRDYTVNKLKLLIPGLRAQEQMGTEAEAREQMSIFRTQLQQPHLGWHQRGSLYFGTFFSIKIISLTYTNEIAADLK